VNLYLDYGGNNITSEDTCICIDHDLCILTRLDLVCWFEYIVARDLLRFRHLALKVTDSPTNNFNKHYYVT
jgi:hypothetical protein